MYHRLGLPQAVLRCGAESGHRDARWYSRLLAHKRRSTIFMVGLPLQVGLSRVRDFRGDPTRSHKRNKSQQFQGFRTSFAHSRGSSSERGAVNAAAPAAAISGNWRPQLTAAKCRANGSPSQPLAAVASGRAVKCFTVKPAARAETASSCVVASGRQRRDCDTPHFDGGQTLLTSRLHGFGARSSW